MQTPVLLRPATQADLPAMLAIYTPYVETTTISFETAAPSPSEFSARFGATTAAFPWLVCEAGGEVTGYCYASRFGERAAYDWTVTTSVYVAPHSRGTGTGRRLYAALEKLLAAQGYCTMYARVVTPNPESEGFHTACGFEMEAVLHSVGCKFGRFLDVAYYKKALCLYAGNPAPPVPLPTLSPALVANICEEASTR